VLVIGIESINDVPSGQSAATAAACPEGRRLDGGGVLAAGGLSAGLDYTVEVSGPLDGSGMTANTDDLDEAYFWYASVHNSSGSTQTFRVIAICTDGSDATIHAEAFRDSPPTTPGGGGAGGGAAGGGGSAPAGVPAACAGQPATIVGTSEGETLTGTADADVIAGLGGNDILRGLGANDRICGGPGKDRLSGGAGADYLTGGPAADRIFGGPGRDRIIGGPGNDSCTGGPAADKVSGC
jgi:Ca2+-binding RTX toxin-like protein